VLSCGITVPSAAGATATIPLIAHPAGFGDPALQIGSADQAKRASPWCLCVLVVRKEPPDMPVARASVRR
jgi:hypothetical protein